MQTTLSPKIEPFIKTILALSPQEQFDLITFLLQLLFGLRQTQNMPTTMARPPRPKKVEDAQAHFWPDDESIDDFLEFTYQHRRENLVS